MPSSPRPPQASPGHVPLWVHRPPGKVIRLVNLWISLSGGSGDAGYYNIL